VSFQSYRVPNVTISITTIKEDYCLHEKVRYLTSVFISDLMWRMQSVYMDERFRFIHSILKCIKLHLYWLILSVYWLKTIVLHVSLRELVHTFTTLLLFGQSPGVQWLTMWQWCNDSKTRKSSWLKIVKMLWYKHMHILRKKDQDQDWDQW
jgi:hypothetical protein